ncbi:MAG: LPS export ABC transporter periplasmic protein LptC [Bacteriovoracia bacterium]
MSQARLLTIFHYAAGFILFVTIWMLWPRDLGGFYATRRDGSLAVPDYAMTNARYVSVKDGRVEMESQSQDAAFDMQTKRMDAKIVTAYFYNDQNQKTKVTADRAEFFMNERRMHLLDNVRSESADGFVMTGPEAEYQLEKKFFVAPKPVEGESKEKDMQVWGNRAESYLNDTKIYLIGDARANYNEKKHGLTRVRGDKAEVDREREKVLFQNNVQVDQDKMVATGQNAEFFYTRKEQGVRYMSITGDVKITEQKGRYTRSQVAEFFAPTDTVVLSGYPSVYNGDDAVTGDKITLYRTTGVVEVSAANAAATPQHKSVLQKSAPPAAPLTKEDEELIP